MDPRELRVRALREATELGPEPGEAAARWRWDDEWCGAVELLAAVADHDGVVLRRAALDLEEDAGRVFGTARALLLDAAALSTHPQGWEPGLRR